MKIEYLEIVTPEADALCEVYTKLHGVKFSEPNPSFGGARTCDFEGGGMIGIRGPMRPTEEPVIRPYVLTEDIDAAIKAAAEGGGEVAMPPTEIPGQGKFAIYILGGIECGLWQN
ncbi:MAG: hydroxylase [Planctomycetota bacterium]